MIDGTTLMLLGVALQAIGPGHTLLSRWRAPRADVTIARTILEKAYPVRDFAPADIDALVRRID